MKDIVCKELKVLSPLLKRISLKMSLDYKQNVMLLVQNDTDQTCIIYLDKIIYI